MRFSRKTDYGVILIEALRSSFEGAAFIALSEIAARQRLPLAFLEKLAEVLRRNGYVDARRGVGGGYRLVKDPKTITLRELVEVFEEPRMMRCMHSPHPEKHCSLVPVCPTRKTWRVLESRVMQELDKITVAEL